MIASIGSLLKGLAWGAAGMYFLDPDRGRRRRAGVADRATHLLHEVDSLWQKGCRDLTNRSYGVAAEARRLVSSEPASDDVLVARVRAVLGHHACDARHIDVTAQDGTVVLRGTVRPGEPERIIPAIEQVPGVRLVESSLTAAGPPVEPHAARTDLTPGLKLLMVSGGSLLVLNCLLRRGTGPTVLGMAGFGMLVRGIMDRPGQFAGLSADRGIDVRKSIQIDAPIEKVFEFFSDPSEMSALLPYVTRSEAVGDGIVRWTLEGPAGIGQVAFDERIVETVENERIVWESDVNSPIRYIGETRFQPSGSGTQVDLRFLYFPPGGALTHTAASFFGVDPKSQFDTGLNRIKQRLEEGTVPGTASSNSVKEHRG